MTKIATLHLIAKILEHVPAPYVPEAAEAFDGVLTAIEQTHSIDLSDVKAEIAAAREPWQRIYDKASGAPAGADGHGPTFGGSTGE